MNLEDKDRKKIWIKNNPDKKRQYQKEYRARQREKNSEWKNV